jgi:hypothetical protein
VYEEKSSNNLIFRKFSSRVLTAAGSLTGQENIRRIFIEERQSFYKIKTYIYSIYMHVLHKTVSGMQILKKTEFFTCTYEESANYLLKDCLHRKVFTQRIMDNKKLTVVLNFKKI